jgi:hypothetical protein
MKTASSWFLRSSSQVMSGDQIHARAAVHIGEGHAHIDQDQPLVVFGPIAVDIAIHADLSRATEREVNQSFAAHVLP